MGRDSITDSNIKLRSEVTVKFADGDIKEATRVFASP